MLARRGVISINALHRRELRTGRMPAANMKVQLLIGPSLRPAVLAPMAASSVVQFLLQVNPGARAG
jgi:hypothetical protein